MIKKAKPSISSMERAVVKCAIAQFRAHLAANNYSAENWLANLKSEGRTEKTMALIRAVAKLDNAMRYESEK